MTDKRLMLTTASSRGEAETIANELVSRRLAACVNVLGPVSSIYRWKGAVERAEEYLLIIKSTETLTLPLQAALRELHSYEVPEFISLRVESGLEAYLAWITDSVRK